MDIFRFTNPIEPTKMAQGEVINGITSKMWVERYRDAGEFTFVAPISSGIRKKLPIDSFVSHIGSTEIMIVENHEISKEKDTEPNITITGRGFETFFENRIVGSNNVFPMSGTQDYFINDNTTWGQAVTLISDHIIDYRLLNPDFAIPFTEVISVVSNLEVGISIDRTFSKGDLYTRLLELLAVDNLGIKVVRPGLWSPIGGSNPNTAIVIHKGANKTKSVIFSSDTGEILKAEYLWSNKNMKNSALISGKWIETVYEPIDITKTGYKRKMIYVDASDLDEAYTSVPTGASLTLVLRGMKQRGIDALAALNNVALTKAEISKNTVSSIYRKDFDVGDLISIYDDYNDLSTMRVIEYVEIEDENGYVGYPTLSLY